MRGLIRQFFNLDNKEMPGIGLIRTLVVCFIIATIVAFTHKPDKAQWIQGKLVETFTEDEQSIAVLRVRYDNALETEYYLVQVPMQYLEASTPMRRRNVYRFDRKAVPTDLVHIQREYTVMR